MESNKKTRNGQFRQNLKSLSTHLRRFEKPTRNGYDVFATTYLTSDIPWKRILGDDVESLTVESPPFTPKSKMEQFDRQEKERKLRGESIRKKDLLKHPKEILHDCRDAKISNSELHLAYLYFKGMQFAEVSRALALDEKYPKPDPNVIRRTYSKEHQAAVAAALREAQSKQSLSTEAPWQPSAGQTVAIPTTSLSVSEKSRAMAGKRELDDLMKLWQGASQTVGKPSSIKHFVKSEEEPWQFKAKTGKPRAQPKSKNKVPWRKNIYPPKSTEEKIADLRKKAPPLGPEFLETDRLPGIWEPELMINTFQTSWMEAQNKVEGETETRDYDWTKISTTRKKCLEWLKSIPNSL